MVKKSAEHCASCEAGHVPWYREKLYVTAILAAFLFMISYFVPFLNPLFAALLDYVGLVWWAVLLGLLLGGIIDYFVPRSFIEKHLGQRGSRAIFYSVGLGFLMSACSHGILAIAIELYRKGARTSSVIAFLLASPWANFPVTVLFFGFFGLKALFIVLSAIVIAIITGLVYQVLESRGWVETGSKAQKTSSLAKPRVGAVKGVALGAWSLAKMVLWWILIGMVIASAARAFVPQHFFMAYLGATALGILTVLLLAAVIEVCSEGSAPLAFEIFRQTGAFGNSFVFLMAGVATDYTEIGLIWSNIGRRAAILLPLITVPQILLLGYLFNIFL